MSKMRSSDTFSPISLITWSVFLEVLRRKEFYVLLILIGLFAVGIVIARAAGISTPESATFLINLGMSMAFICAAILAIITSSRLLPTEFENRTIYPLLAKSISRSELLIGKWVATSAVSILSMLILFLVAYIPVPKSPGLSPALLFQTILAKSMAIAMLSAMGILFSLLMPKALNIVILALVYTGSQTIGNFIRAKAIRSSFRGAVEWLVYYLPRFDMLDLTKRYTDEAVALSLPQFAGLIAYPIVATIFILSVACLIFERRSI